MKIIKEMPTEGQFVAVWEHKGVMWSETHKWEDGQLMEYVNGLDKWITTPAQAYETLDPSFIVLEE